MKTFFKNLFKDPVLKKAEKLKSTYEQRRTAHLLREYLWMYKMYRERMFTDYPADHIEPDVMAMSMVLTSRGIELYNLKEYHGEFVGFFPHSNEPYKQTFDVVADSEERATQIFLSMFEPKPEHYYIKYSLIS